MKERDELIGLRDDAMKLTAKIWLHLGPDGEQFLFKLREWFFSLPDEKFDNRVWVRRQREIFDAAQKIISERKEKLSFIPTPSTSDHSSSPPSGPG